MPLCEHPLETGAIMGLGQFRFFNSRGQVMLAWLILVVTLSAMSGCSAKTVPTPLPTVTATPSFTPLPSATFTATSTLTPTPTPTPTLSPSSTPSSTPTPTPTPTATPGPTPDGVYREAVVPILMYHYISEPAPDAHPYRLNNSLAPDMFVEHLDYLQAQGYTTIYFKDLISYLATGAPELPPKPIILTFDDGYEDNYLNAFPALQARGMVGTFFIITDFATQAVTDPAYANYATWEQLREMADAGMEIGSHSRNHPDLAGKDLDYLVWQALGSKESIEANIGYHPHILSYPAGSYDQLVIDVFRSAHFWGAVTTQQGIRQDSDHLFTCKRIRISHDTGVAQLAALLAYDWPE